MQWYVDIHVPFIDPSEHDVEQVHAIHGTEKLVNNTIHIQNTTQ